MSYYHNCIQFISIFYILLWFLFFGDTLYGKNTYTVLLGRVFHQFHQTAPSENLCIGPLACPWEWTNHQACPVQTTAQKKIPFQVFSTKLHKRSSWMFIRLYVGYTNRWILNDKFICWLPEARWKFHLWIINNLPNNENSDGSHKGLSWSEKFLPRVSRCFLMLWDKIHIAEL